MDLLKKILDLNRKYNLIEENDNIIIGFSGGPDSVFLVEMLLQIKKNINFEITLVHINHMLRGNEADADEEFSHLYAQKNNLKIFSKKINITEIAKKDKKTFEEVGRIERYNFFKEICDKVGANKIATAHNKDDQIETFLFRLIRGTSLEGLEGISIKKMNLIRPISEIYKDDILKYLNKNEIQYKIDKTNFENDYTRNSIRLDLIPFIEKRYNSKFKDKLYSLIEEIRENNIQNSISLEEYINEDNKIELASLLELSSFYIRKIIGLFLNKNNILINRAKIQEIEKILHKNGMKKLDLNAEMKIVKDYKFVYLEKKYKKEFKNLKNIKFKVFEDLKFNNFLISSKIYEPKKDKINSETIILEIPLDSELELRYRREGDTIKLKNSEGYITKKIKDVFINEKIPKDAREKIPLLLYRNNVIWIKGLRRGEILNLTEEERKISQKILLSVREVAIEQ
ncbi:MAG: tRNA lysidine(34) synthetase TilS [Fusobacterium sp.]|nr:tRNA lysidine(34) synthetase TilS [Fusobacterium sp.]